MAELTSDQKIRLIEFRINLLKDVGLKKQFLKSLSDKDFKTIMSENQNLAMETFAKCMMKFMMQYCDENKNRILGNASINEISELLNQLNISIDFSEFGIQELFAPTDTRDNPTEYKKDILRVYGDLYEDEEFERLSRESGPEIKVRQRIKEKYMKLVDDYNKIDIDKDIKNEANHQTAIERSKRMQKFSADAKKLINRGCSKELKECSDKLQAFQVLEKKLSKMEMADNDYQKTSAAVAIAKAEYTKALEKYKTIYGRLESRDAQYRQKGNIYYSKEV